MNSGNLFDQKPSTLLYFHEGTSAHVKAWFFHRYNAEVKVVPIAAPFSYIDLDDVKRSHNWLKFSNFREIADTISFFSPMVVIIPQGDNSKAIVGEKSTWFYTSKFLNSL